MDNIIDPVLEIIMILGHKSNDINRFSDRDIERIHECLIDDTLPSIYNILTILTNIDHINGLRVVYDNIDTIILNLRNAPQIPIDTRLQLIVNITTRDRIYMIRELGPYLHFEYFNNFWAFPSYDVIYNLINSNLDDPTAFRQTLQYEIRILHGYNVQGAILPPHLVPDDANTTTFRFDRLTDGIKKKTKRSKRRSKRKSYRRSKSRSRSKSHITNEDKIFKTFIKTILLQKNEYDYEILKKKFFSIAKYYNNAKKRPRSFAPKLYKTPLKLLNLFYHYNTSNAFHMALDDDRNALLDNETMMKTLDKIFTTGKLK